MVCDINNKRIISLQHLRKILVFFIPIVFVICEPFENVLHDAIIEHSQKYKQQRIFN